MSTTSPHGMSSSEKRVVVTGLGVVSPLGSQIDAFWHRLVNATAEPEIESVSTIVGKTAEFTGQLADFGELPPAARKQLAKSLKVMNRETQLGVAAGLQALRDCDLTSAYKPTRIGIAFGAGNACVAPEDFQAGVHACEDGAGGVDLSEWGSRGLPEMAPLWLLRCLPNMAACHLAILANLQGPSNTITQQSLGVDLALAEACRILRSGDADAMLVGGSGTTLGGLHRLHAVWADAGGPETATSSEISPSRRLSPSEGAAALVLETLADAVQRGARIHGEVLACVSVSRGRSRASSAPLQLAAAEALARSRLTWNDVEHVHLPDIGTAADMRAGWTPPSSESGREHPRIPAVSGQALWGNAGAGSSAIDLVANLLALNRGQLFAAPLTGECLTDAVRPGEASRGESTGTACLKFSRHGDRQVTCVALARVPA
ncbi:MAG: beta-ketoacyl synthase N-terminal-like domain-containing protein [Planctomycetaceae bacterium]